MLVLYNGLPHYKLLNRLEHAGECENDRKEKKMSDALIAACGLVCTECQAFIATRTGDSQKLKTLALEWYGKEGDATFCMCDGCTPTGHKNQFCQECGVRSCALERGVVNCAHCSDYGCDTLTGLFQHIPVAKENLEKIRTSLSL